ncbi:MAG: hypothetical protein A2Y60_06340 [Chloroflexi bacterium RBG_13_54_9]|nr:MAG: hypothetical protein A2Y60_06340 [Chloroflexi bacterium RBG_13_54_9]
MGRLPNWRRVSSVPEITYFKPAGIPLRVLQEVSLTVDEAEAIRLKDLQGLEQEECAESMRVSRTTFARILDSARQKVADSLLNGKAIRIEGGNFEMAMRRFRCLEGHEWDVPFEIMTTAPPQVCPKCKTPNILPLQPPAFGWGRARWGRGGGRRRWQQSTG